MEPLYEWTTDRLLDHLGKIGAVVSELERRGKLAAYERCAAICRRQSELYRDLARRCGSASPISRDAYLDNSIGITQVLCQIEGLTK